MENSKGNPQRDPVLISQLPSAVHFTLHALLLPQQSTAKCGDLSGCKPPTTNKLKHKEDVQETNKKYHNYDYREHFKAVEQKGRCGWLSMFSSFSFSINLRENWISTINRNFREKFRKKWNLLMGRGRKCENFKDTGVHDLYLAPTFEDLHHCLVLNWTYLRLNYTMPSSINFFTKLNRSFSLILSRQQTFKKW